MAIIVEDGTGKADSNSYDSVVNADTYHQNHGDPLPWSDLELAQKEEGLRMATQAIDALYLTRLKGVKNSREQALQYPRFAISDDQGYVRDNNVVPLEVRQATAELALLHHTETAGLIPNETSAAIKLESVKLGPLSKTTEYQGAKPSRTIFRKANLLLATILLPLGLVERG